MKNMKTEQINLTLLKLWYNIWSYMSLQARRSEAEQTRSQKILLRLTTYELITLLTYWNKTLRKEFLHETLTIFNYPLGHFLREGGF